MKVIQNWLRITLNGHTWYNDESFGFTTIQLFSIIEHNILCV
jgi:hypothetical protein